MSHRISPPAGFPSVPHLGEIWWVGVENAGDPSGGWLVLADQGAQGAAQIQSTFAQAGIGVVAAISASDLALALEHPDEGDTLAVRMNTQGLQVSRHPQPPAETLVNLRLAYPEDRIVLVETITPTRELLARMHALGDAGSFEGVRMDLRSPPRGQGAWGLALVRSS